MRSTQAMTLLEVTAAMGLLIVGLFTVFGAMGTSSQVRHRAKAQGMAIEAIQTQIERLQAMGFASVDDAVPAGSGAGFAVEGLQPTAGRSQAGSVVREADSTSTRLHLRFTVDWTDAGGPSSVVVHYHHVNRGG